MCELLGVSVHPAATLGVYFPAFRPRAEHNPSGWGIGWFDGGGAHVIKDDSRADVSPRADELVSEPPRSETFIVHVRAATVGRIASENSHPFSGTVNGRCWLFAHNGTIKRLEGLVTGASTPLGDTDSERAFHHVLHRLEQLGPRPTDEDLDDLVVSIADELSSRGTANFLLTDGVTLYAYYDGWKTLHLLQRQARDLGTIGLEDDDYHLALRVSDAPEESAVIVASVPLTDERWTRLDAGDLLVCRRGQVVRRLRTNAAAAIAST
jgi:glutamine amidotransferase